MGSWISRYVLQRRFTDYLWDWVRISCVVKVGEAEGEAHLIADYSGLRYRRGRHCRVVARHPRSPPHRNRPPPRPRRVPPFRRPPRRRTPVR